MLNGIKIDRGGALNVLHSRDFYKGKSFCFAGSWTPGCHYINDEYICHFVTHNRCVLMCSKSHMSTIENEPKDFIFDENGYCIGIDSDYWELVLPGLRDEATTKQEIIDLLGYEPADKADLDQKVDKVNGKGLSTNDFSNELKSKLEALNIKYNTTAYWNSAIGYIPQAGEIIIYSDRSTIDASGNQRNIPGIKIGSGNGYVQDLAFVGEETAHELFNHINDQIHHITQEERLRWNRKLNVTDNAEVVNGALVFNRN